MREKFVNSILLFIKDISEALIYAFSILLYKALDSCLMKSLICRWVLCVHIDLAVCELEALGRLLVKHNVKRDLL